MNQYLKYALFGPQVSIYQLVFYFLTTVKPVDFFSQTKPETLGLALLPQDDTQLEKYLNAHEHQFRKQQGLRNQLITKWLMTYDFSKHDLNQKIGQQLYVAFCIPIGKAHTVHILPAKSQNDAMQQLMDNYPIDKETWVIIRRFDTIRKNLDFYLYLKSMQNKLWVKIARVFTRPFSLIVYEKRYEITRF